MRVAASSGSSSSAAMGMTTERTAINVSSSSSSSWAIGCPRLPRRGRAINGERQRPRALPAGAGIYSPRRAHATRVSAVPRLRKDPLGT